MHGLATIWPGLTVDWAQLATELLKLLGGAVAALLVGLFAWWRGWIGQRTWDTAKLTYELFKAEQLRRLDLLRSLRESMEKIDEAVLIVHVEKVHERDLTGNHGLGVNNDRVVRARNRRMLYERVIEEELERSISIAGRYGMTSDGGRVRPLNLRDVVFRWTADLRSALSNDPGDPAERAGLIYLTLQGTTTVMDLLSEEEKILSEGKPGSHPPVFRKQPYNRAMSSLLDQPLSSAAEAHEGPLV